MQKQKAPIYKLSHSNKPKHAKFSVENIRFLGVISPLYANKIVDIGSLPTYFFLLPFRGKEVLSLKYQKPWV